MRQNTLIGSPCRRALELLRIGYLDEPLAAELLHAGVEELARISVEPADRSSRHKAQPQ
ncbi:hypothetical protein [Bradyrhizobium sp. AZCC 1693]|uniref:hypothetical protein n=1 Tax=Bradyrhizobium sp. AZCC 1693 TaxID=3117029 RepID=UPI002FF102CD